MIIAVKYFDFKVDEILLLESSKNLVSEFLLFLFNKNNFIVIQINI